MSKPTPQELKQSFIENPKKRSRDLALELGVSEGELLASNCGDYVTRLNCKPGEFVQSLTALGPVMALTRNESVVHEKTGVYDNIHVNKMHTIVLNEDIDLRVFMSHWTNIFSVTQEGDNGTKRSFQVFNNQGEAIHKVHMKPQSNIEAFDEITSRFKSDDQSPDFAVTPLENKTSDIPDDDVDLVLLQEKWAAMTDVHQFIGILKKLNCSRYQAVKLVGEEFAEQLDPSCIPSLLTEVVQEETPIMCFVGSKGCIQIHSGPIYDLKAMGPWYNIFDPNFNLHLRLDHISEVWAVRKPTDVEYVTSVEVYDKDKNLIVQFFGKRTESKAERPDWRAIVTSMPRLQTALAS